MKLSDYDLIGYKIISPFHLAALTAYASRIQHGLEPLNVLVLVSKGPWQHNILSSSGASHSRLNLTFCNEEQFIQKQSFFWPLFLLLKPIASRFARLTRVKIVPVCSPTMTCVKLSVASIHNTFFLSPIVIDEGIGSFNSTYIFKEEAKGLVRSAPARTFFSQLFQFLWKNLPLFGGSRQALFSFDGDQPVLNETVAESYRLAFRNGYLARHQPAKFSTDTVLILTQPFAEAGYCTEAELIAGLCPWIEYARQLGGEVLLKPHPAESVAKYESLGVECLEYSGPVEELFATFSQNIREVWGFNSTSLITGRALFGLVSKRIELPWPGTSIKLFGDEARALFGKYTEPARQLERFDTFPYR